MAGTSHDYVRGFSLDSIFTLIDMNQETWTLKIRSEGRIGFLYSRDGEIIDAEVRDVKGYKAALELIAWDSPEIEIIKFCNKPKCIHTSMMQLLLDGKRMKDETKDERILESKACAEAVAHIEGFRFKRGQELLIGILNKNRTLHRAWLWYSRTLGSMKGIESAIERAIRLAPDDDEIGEEKVRFDRAKRTVNDTRVKRCPFCWAPLNLNARQCSACGLHLLITRGALAGDHSRCNSRVVDVSVKRLSHVMERENHRNLYASYYMAMAHCNIRDMDRTLELLNDTVALAGDQPFFSDQLKLYLNWMASNQVAEAEELQEASTVDAAGEGKTILVVEDSSTTRKVIAVTLNLKGYRIIEAVDGLEALSKLSEEKPDLILLDIILPKMNGYEILSIIKNKRDLKNIPVIMLTSRDGFMSRMKGKIAGTAAYLTKPFNPDDLLRTIVRHI
ncbi:response regulator [Desulfoluna sp.]|uniref:response regulator n=1 Tax=Desulfoluna sp. TaxID=2045199 RepID=UPI00262AE3AF|nr:response regulator [Desulfoluna sp.]